jgi:hypothetical protein
MFTNKFSPAALLTLAASMVASAQTPFIIENLNSALVMEVPASVETLPFMMIDQSTLTGGTNQQWVLHRPGAAFAYEIRSVASGMVLDAPVAASGLPIQQFPADGNSTQLWHISRAKGSTGYEIVSDALADTGSSGSLSTYAHLALDVPGSSTSDGTLIEEVTENNGNNQQWQLYPEDLVTVMVSASASTITIKGYHFKPNASVQAVLESAGDLPAAYAGWTNVGDGPFTSYYSVPDGYSFSSTGGYVVVVFEDENRNVLAIGSAPGTYTAKPK